MASEAEPRSQTIRNAMTAFREIMEWVGLGFDTVGVIVIAGGVLVAGGRLAADLVNTRVVNIRPFRQRFAGAIVLGLEFLVAGDIIRTVVVAPTLENVAVLAVIVLIRTVLSMALQVEIEGRWPWQERKTTMVESLCIGTDVSSQRVKPPDV